VQRWIGALANHSWTELNLAGRSRWGSVLVLLLALAGVSACADSDELNKTAKPREVAPADSEEPKKITKPREVAPAFSLPILDAEGEVSLESLRGKIVVIDFWATWCTPCEFQVPELNAFHEATRSDPGVALFGISIDTEGPDVVAKWTTEKGVRYPILLADDDLAMEYGAQGFPTVVIIRADGTIDSRHAGLIQQVELEEIVDALREAG
jgi:thiol-disulfide isomerase/thioredoxin